MKKFLLMILIISVIVNACSFIVSADNTEGETSVENTETDLAPSEDAPSGFEALTFEQQLVFLLSVFLGLFVGQAFSFWKW